MDKRIINIYIDDSNPCELKIKCNNKRVMRRIAHFISFFLSEPSLQDILRKELHE